MAQIRLDKLLKIKSIGICASNINTHENWRNKYYISLFVAILAFYRMLIIVTVIFFLSWAPLNIFNIVLDIFEPFDNSDEEETKMMLMVFAFCHLSAMTSVCSNPIMYGFLNENFKQTLHSLLFGCCKRNVR